MTSACADAPRLARVRALPGVDPSTTGYRPAAATLTVLRRAGITIADVDHVGCKEMCAAQKLPVRTDLGPLDYLDDKINRHCGAVALGHPLGCSGAGSTTPLLHHMKERGGSPELLPMCIGPRQAIAAVFEHG